MSAAYRLRTDVRPSPADWDDDDPMTLVEAYTVFRERYPVKVSTMRSEIHRGRLTATYVGGSYYVTPASLKALFQCPVKPKARGSISERVAQTPGPARASRTGISSETERLRSAQAAALNAWGMRSGN